MRESGSPRRERRLRPYTSEPIVPPFPLTAVPPFPSRSPRPAPRPRLPARHRPPPPSPRREGEGGLSGPRTGTARAPCWRVAEPGVCVCVCACVCGARRLEPGFLRGVRGGGAGGGEQRGEGGRRPGGSWTSRGCRRL